MFCSLKNAKGRKPRKKGARAGDAWYWSREVQGTGAGRYGRYEDLRSYPLPTIRLDGLFKILAVNYVQISLTKIMQSYSFEALKTYVLKVLCRKAVLNT